jgi:hypothetical protein
MTALEMQYEFEKRVGTLNYFGPDKFTSAFIQGLLNLSQEYELQDIYSKRIGSRNTKFEGTEKLRREISNLITSYKTTSFDSDSSQLHNNAVFVTLPANYLYGIEERCIVSSGGETASVTVKPMTHDEYNDDIKNPFLWPDDSLVWRFDYGLTGATAAKRHELIHGEDETITEYEVRYIRRPQQIILDPSSSQDCELDKSTHESIINRAIKMAVAEKNK